MQEQKKYQIEEVEHNTHEEMNFLVASYFPLKGIILMSGYVTENFARMKIDFETVF